MVTCEAINSYFCKTIIVLCWISDNATTVLPLIVYLYRHAAPYGTITLIIAIRGNRVVVIVVVVFFIINVNDHVCVSMCYIIREETMLVCKQEL